MKPYRFVFTATGDYLVFRREDNLCLGFAEKDELGDGWWANRGKPGHRLFDTRVEAAEYLMERAR